MESWKLKNGEVIRYETEFGHSYTIDGEPIVGVTTMLSMGVPHEQGLLEYFKRTDKDTQDQILLDSQERGTNVHQTIEALLLGEKVHPKSLTREAERRGVAAFIDFYLTVQPTDVITEQVVAYDDGKYKFAGTLDFIGTINGKRILIDLKTSKIPSIKHSLQAQAYKKAVKQSTGENIDDCYVLYLGTTHKGTRSKEDDNGIPNTGLMWAIYKSTKSFDDVKLAYQMMLLVNGGKYPEPPKTIAYPEFWQLTKEVESGRVHETVGAR